MGGNQKASRILIHEAFFYLKIASQKADQLNEKITTIKTGNILSVILEGKVVCIKKNVYETWRSWS